MINFRLKNVILANLQTFFITNSKIMKKRPDLILPLILMMTFYWTSCQRTADPDVAVTGMRTDYTLNPTGIDHSRPQLTWQLSDNRTGAAMTAFRVLVAINDIFPARKVGKLARQAEMVQHLGVETFGVVLQRHGIDAARVQCLNHRFLADVAEQRDLSALVFG